MVQARTRPGDIARRTHFEGTDLAICWLEDGQGSLPLTVSAEIPRDFHCYGESHSYK